MIEASPYTPGFGIVPEVLTGRAEALERHVTALHQGPRHPEFTQAVIGERGVGKTVYLSVLADRMHDDHGWIVLPYQARAGTEAIPEILAALPDAAGRSLRGRELRGLERQLTVEVNAGIVKVGGTITAPSQAGGQALSTHALQRALDATGERAAKYGTGVLVTVDEAQSLSPAAIADLGMIAQTVAHRQGRPVAIVMAGTPELSAQLVQSGTFLERMPRTELGMLTSSDARLALLEPANARGVTWDDRALTAVSNQAQGYPYFVQLGGHAAWQHADDDSRRITAADGTAACHELIATADRMFRDRWARLGPAQREYLATVAISHREFPLGPVSTRHIAAVLGKEHSELTRVRGSLINDHHLLRSAGRGEVEFALPRFAGWLRDQCEPTDENGVALPIDPEFLEHIPSIRSATPADARAAAELTRATRGARPGPADSAPDAAPRRSPPPGSGRSRGRS